MKVITLLHPFVLIRKQEIKIIFLRVEYTYDSINQLKTESYFDSLTAQTPSRKITYKYDIMGNRTERIVEGTGVGTISYQYNTFNELLSRTGNVNYTHDFYGNMVTAGGNTFVYNDKNQLIRVESGATVIATYEYNWLGLRSKKITVSKTENYYYTGDDLAYITDETNKVKYFFVRDINGVLLQMIDYTGATPATYFYIRDAHGNIVALADSTGVRKVNYEFDAWGLLINTPETNVFTGNGELLRDANPFRYSGYQFDPETEFYYLKNRYYSQYLGRFLTEDVILTKNRYMYCNNNPVNFVDPSGLWEPIGDLYSTSPYEDYIEGAEKANVRRGVSNSYGEEILKTATSIDSLFSYTEYALERKGLQILKSPISRSSSKVEKSVKLVARWSKASKYLNPAGALKKFGKFFGPFTTLLYGATSLYEDSVNTAYTSEQRNTAMLITVGATLLSLAAVVFIPATLTGIIVSIAATSLISYGASEFKKGMID